MRSSTLLIIAALAVSATAFKWSQLRNWRGLLDIQRGMKDGRLRISPYQHIAGFLSLVLTVVGLFLALSGD
jgi:hypothetical protein